MADASFTLYRGAPGTSSINLYTSPVGMATKVSNIAITNTAGTAGTATIALGGVNLCSALSIAANSTTYLVPEQILYNGEAMTGLGSTSSINFHIAGVEIY
jgi:hypothetical protein